MNQYNPNTWNQSTWGQTPQYQPPAQPQAYQPPGSNPNGGSSGGMYQPVAPVAPVGLPGGLDFTQLNSGSNVQVGDMTFTPGNQTGMYQAYTNLLGTGLQTQAQQNVAQTQILPQMTQQYFNQSAVFPYLQQLIGQYGLGGGGGGLSGHLTASAISGLNPAHEQAALNAASANAARAAAAAQQQGLRQVAGSGWSPSSPVGAALNASSQAARARNEEEARRNIRNDFAQQRTTNLAQAINSQTAQMAPIWSLLSGLMR